VPASLLQMMSVGQKFNSIGVGKVSEKVKMVTNLPEKALNFLLLLISNVCFIQAREFTP
jgi:hypothetical protein